MHLTAKATASPDEFTVKTTNGTSGVMSGQFKLAFMDEQSLNTTAAQVKKKTSATAAPYDGPQLTLLKQKQPQNIYLDQLSDAKVYKKVPAELSNGDQVESAVHVPLSLASELGTNEYLFTTGQLIQTVFQITQLYGAEDYGPGMDFVAAKISHASFSKPIYFSAKNLPDLQVKVEITNLKTIGKRSIMVLNAKIQDEAGSEIGAMDFSAILIRP
jgi:hypothetical protein